MNKTLERYEDLVLSLEIAWYDEEASELQEYLLNPEMDEEDIEKHFKGRLEEIESHLIENEDGTDCVRDEDGEQYETAYKWITKVTDIDIHYNGYKDVVKYDRCYLFYDNVLDRWMVRWEQWIWLSNIEKDDWKNWIVPLDYIKRWKNVKEKLTRMPRIQEFTLKEYNNMLNKHWIDIDWQQVIDETNKEVITRNKKIEVVWKNICPSIEDIEKMIGEEINYGENQWLLDYIKRTCKDSSSENNNTEPESELDKRLEQQSKQMEMLNKRMEEQSKRMATHLL